MYHNVGARASNDVYCRTTLVLLIILIRYWITGKLSTDPHRGIRLSYLLVFSIESFPDVNIHLLFDDSVRFFNIYMSMNTIYDCMSNI